MPKREQPLGRMDPSVHLFGMVDYKRASDGRSVKVPIALADYAEGVNRSLAGPENRDSESAIENDWTTGVVAFSRSRGLILSELLTELSARLAPGTSVGTMRSDGRLAAVVAELAQHLDAARTASESEG